MVSVGVVYMHVDDEREVTTTHTGTIPAEPVEVYLGNAATVFLSVEAARKLRDGLGAALEGRL